MFQTYDYFKISSWNIIYKTLGIRRNCLISHSTPKLAYLVGTNEMRIKNKSIILIATTLIILVLLYNIAAPLEIEGKVEAKAINGKMSGNIVEGILFNSPYENKSWMQVENKDFEYLFPSEGKNAIVNDSLHNFMQRKYIDIDYIVTVELKSSDPVNDVTKGESYAYLVNREDFNKAKKGDEIIFKVSIFESSTMYQISEDLNLLPSFFTKGAIRWKLE